MESEKGSSKADSSSSLPCLSLCPLHGCLRPVEILKTDSVVRILGNDGKPIPIPEQQIFGIQTLVKNGVTITPCPYLREGMRVRVVNGPLIGIEGILLKTLWQKHRLDLSVDIIKESVSVEIDELDVEPIQL